MNTMKYRKVVSISSVGTKLMIKTSKYNRADSGSRILEVSSILDISQYQ